MKKALKIIIPILMVLLILASIGWYLFFYDSELTQSLLIHQAHRFEKKGNHAAAVWMYNLAYSQSGEDSDVALELAEYFRSAGNYTKAEYTLSSAIADGGSAELYTALCRTYVEQDKLMDAVAMLDGIEDPAIKAELDRQRPAMPVPSQEPGFYNQYIDLDFSHDQGTMYVSADRTYPSVALPAFEGPLSLPSGESTVLALSVGENGLVSPLSISTYTIVGVIEQVQFRDPEMEKAIRSALGKKEADVIYTSDLWEITQFTAPEKAESYDDLAGLIYLKQLTLPSPGIGNMGFLPALDQLETLTVTGTTLSSDDLTAIGSVHSLTGLTLRDCGVSSLSSLTKLVNLRQLDLSSNSIRDLTALEAMIDLESLNLKNNAVESVTSLSALPALTELDVSYNRLTSVASLGSAVSLQSLDISHNSLSDLTAVSNLKNLSRLAAAENNLADISPLSACPSLEVLDISGNQIVSLDALSAMPNLQELSFAHNQVELLPSWPVDCALRILDGSHNNIKSLEPLTDFYHLNRVNVDYNPELESIDPLAGCPKLVQVDAYGTLVTDVKALTDHGIVVHFDPTSISAQQSEE